MVTGAMLKVLEGLHHRVVIWIVGNTAHCMVDGECEWPPVSDTLDILGMWPINEYIRCRKATIEACIAFWTMYELCTGAENILGYSRYMRWWYQDVVCEVE